MAATKTVALITLLLAICYLGASASWETPSEAPNLTSEKFDELVKQGRWMIMFYADWCGVCNAFKPSYEEIASGLAKSHPNIHMAKVNLDKDMDLAFRFQVSSIPTFFLINDGQVYHYNSTLNIGGITNFIHGEYKKTEPWTGWSSPFSVIPIFGGNIVFVGTQIIKAAEFLHKDYDVPMWAIISVAFLVLLLTSVALGILIRICLPMVFPPPQRVKVIEKEKKTK